MDSKDCLDWADAQADLSVCWMHMPFCRFCHALAQIQEMNVLFVDFIDV